MSVKKLVQRVAQDLIRERDLLREDTFSYTPAKRIRKCTKCDFTTTELVELMRHAQPRMGSHD